MSNFGQRQHDDTTELSGSSDSPKPHGDELFGAVKGVASDERPRAAEASHLDDAQTTSDSAKLHGDKLSGATRTATGSDKPDH